MNAYLSTIYCEYFNIIESYIGDLFDKTRKPESQSDYLSNLAGASKVIYYSLDDLRTEIEDFWKKNGDTVYKVINDKQIYKAIHCGNLTPNNIEVFVSKTAIYVDSIIIMDPLSRLSGIRAAMNPQEFVQQLTYHMFKLLDLKELFFSERTELPILLIFPCNDVFSNIYSKTNQIGKLLISRLFDYKFECVEEILQTLSEYTTAEDIVKNIRDEKVIKYRDDLNLIEYINDIHNSFVSGLNMKFRPTEPISVGTSFAQSILGKSLNLSEKISLSDITSAQLVFDNTDLWHSYSLVLQENSIIMQNPDDLILRALQLDEVSWLGNIPVNKIKQIREEDQLGEIRNIIRDGIFSSIYDDEKAVVGKLSENVERAIKTHSDSLKDLSRGLRKKFFIDVPVTLTGIIMGIITFSIGLPAIIGVTTSLYGAFDLGKAIVENEKEKSKVKKQSISLLYDARRVE